jgi:hypothetical protein
VSRYVERDVLENAAPQRIEDSQLNLPLAAR